MKEDILGRMKELNPHACIAIGWWGGGKLEISFDNAPVEVLCYMHQMLGFTIQERLKQLVQGGMTETK